MSRSIGQYVAVVMAVVDSDVARKVAMFVRDSVLDLWSPNQL